ncbi:penicillin acylase family protein [Aureivirga sp. CE67]|uniref:penicillin acylase family protein n=1 Tax=Aureivirga sp. CE67 TaxID=1788983 RepID=UPI0018C8DD29|nr:penicillin acylase family protein [Aureivirga sp. CE67]
MRFFKKLFKGLLFLVVILFVLGFFFREYLKPNYKGHLRLDNLKDSTSVYFDDYGVPHIYANNEEDAMRALGFVHAQDRLWQMELMRRIAPGRLSEIFGKDMLEVDKMFSSMEIAETSKFCVQQLDKNSKHYKLANAYLEGVNQFLMDGTTPVEFYLLGIQKERFTMEDVYNIYGYMSFSFALGQKTDPLMTALKEKLGEAYLKELPLVTPKNYTKIPVWNTDNIKKNFTSKVNKVLDESQIPLFMGSNSWVLNSNKTKSGKVLFANDPHISYSQPAVWYEAHIVTPNHEMYGYYLACSPFPLLGHNRDYAYGLTMFENDDLDFYALENNSKNKNEYQSEMGWEKYTIKNKEIRIKGGDVCVHSVKYSDLGPIINDIFPDVELKSPVAMWWMYTQFPGELLEAVYTMSHARNSDDFRKGTHLINAPGLNVMYGSKNDTVAWFATGKLYENNKGVNRKFVLDGTTDYDYPKRYLDRNENPYAINPPQNYVYSANNQPAAVNGFLYPGYYAPDNRARRIEHFLNTDEKWDYSNAKKMAVDVTSAVTPTIIEHLGKSLDTTEFSMNEKKAWHILKTWKGDSPLNSVASTIYYKWEYDFLRNTYEDEMGKDLFLEFLRTFTLKKSIILQAEKENSIWWDNVHTIMKEPKKDIVTKAFKESIAFLEKQLGDDIDKWEWKKVQTVEFQHPLGKVAALRPIFSVGPFPTHGAREVINNQETRYDSTGVYKVKAGPSTRRIIDFNDVENAVSISPTGQSGNPFSPHYKDQTDMYLKGKFRKMLLNKNEIQKSENKIIFTKN